MRLPRPVLTRAWQYFQAAIKVATPAILTVLLCSCATNPRPRASAPQPGAGITRAFAEDLGRSIGAPMLESNRVVTLINGVEIFPAMLRAIQGASNTITFENFIWRSGVLSDQFINAMIERASAGVDVRVLIDAFGALGLKNEDKQRLRDGGVRFVKYNTLWRFWNWNHRTHRKLMVVDGRIGFIGGACIGDNWMGDAEHEPLWRDNHYQVEGPVVAQIQRAIEINWLQVKQEPFTGQDFYPELPPAGTSLAHCFWSGPNEGKHNAHQSYLEAIQAAKKHIRLAHSYFVPDQEFIRALVNARKRGVRVEVMTPGAIHANVVRRASRSRWGRLIDAGVEFYEYQGSAFHCKLLIVDDAWVSVGSVNFDERSFHINDEANLQVFDPDFARREIEVFEEDKRRTLRITKESYKRRGVWIRMVENFYGMFRSVL